MTQIHQPTPKAELLALVDRSTGGGGETPSDARLPGRTAARENACAMGTDSTAVFHGLKVDPRDHIFAKRVTLHSGGRFDSHQLFPRSLAR